MKKHMLCLLVAGIIAPTILFADEAERAIQDAENQLEMSNIQLEQRKAETEFEFGRQMRQLELEKARLEIENAHRRLGRHPGPKPERICAIILLVAILNRILAPIWIYRDMRQRNAGSVILVLLGVLGGLAGLLTYAVVRLGDVNTSARTRR
ncbi:MAG: hypothetical protein JXN61_07060 [Sedimentisphaerales bacterium]|nr:hypothetical protein [Sedimentisphaerales bacterium]